MIRASIVGTGGFVPSRVIDNSFFEDLIPGAEDWIRSRTGIQQRRFAAPEQSTSDLAVQAARNALVNAQMPSVDLDTIILATSTPDYSLPSTACIVQGSIGANRAAAFDINSVCGGFVYGLDLADALIRAGKSKNVMVIGADIYSRIIDLEDRNTGILFGDGAAAVILSPSVEGTGIIESIVGSDGRNWGAIQVPASGSRQPVDADAILAKENLFRMEGKRVYTFATQVVPKLMSELLIKTGLPVSEIDFVIPHQANIRIIDVLAQKMKIPPERFLTNLNRYGNTAAASVGLVFHESVRDGVIRKGHKVMLLGFGGGLSWGGCIIQM